MHSSKPNDTFEPSAHSFPTSSSRLRGYPPLPVLTDSGSKCSNAAQFDEKQTRKRKLRRRRPGALRQNVTLADTDMSDCPMYTEWMDTLKDSKTVKQYSLYVRRFVQWLHQADVWQSGSAFRHACTARSITQWGQMLATELHLGQRTVRNYLTALISFISAVHSRDSPEFDGIQDSGNNDDAASVEAHWSRILTRIREVRKQGLGAQLHRQTMHLAAAKAANRCLTLDQLVIARAFMLNSMADVVERLGRIQQCADRSVLQPQTRELKHLQQLVISLIMSAVAALRPCELLSMQTHTLRSCLGDATKRFDPKAVAADASLHERSVPLSKVKATSATTHHFLGLNHTAIAVLRVQLLVVHHRLFDGAAFPYVFECARREDGSAKCVNNALQAQIPLIPGLEAYGQLTANCMRRSLTTIAMEEESTERGLQANPPTAVTNLNAIHASMAHTQATAARHYHLVNGTEQRKGAEQLERLLDYEESAMVRNGTYPIHLTRSSVSIQRIHDALDGRTGGEPGKDDISSKPVQMTNAGSIEISKEHDVEARPKKRCKVDDPKDHSITAASSSASSSSCGPSAWPWDQLQTLVVTLMTLEKKTGVDSTNNDPQWWQRVASASQLPYSAHEIQQCAQRLQSLGWIPDADTLYTESDVEMHNVLTQCHTAWKQQQYDECERRRVRQRLQQLANWTP
jgi:hypothetical protein